MSIYDYDYDFVLKVDDLKGMEHELKIAKVFKHMVYVPEKRAKESRIALRFENRKKFMILNVTQAAALEHIAGTDDETKWVGKTVTLAAGVAFTGQKTIKVLAHPSGAAQLFKNALKNVLVEAQ